MIKTTRINILMALTCFVMLAGCKTAEGYRQKLESNIGRSEHKIVSLFGVPDNAYKLKNGGKVLQYKKLSRYVIPGMTSTTPQTTHHSGNLYGGGMTGSYSGTSTAYITTQQPDRVVSSMCQTSFMLNHKRVVVDYVFAGSGCVAKEDGTMPPGAAIQANAIECCGEALPPNTAGKKFKKCVEQQIKDISYFRNQMARASQ